MKRYIKIISYTLAAAFFSVALSGCDNNKNADPNANRVTVWSFEDEDVWKPIEKSFEQANKGYDLRYVKQSLDNDYENKVLNSILSGDGPDVWAMPNDWVYRHKSKLYPMPADLAKKTNLDTQFVPLIKDTIYYDNQIYALSPTAEPLIVYYNSTLMKQTLNEFTDTHKGEALAEQRKTATRLLSQLPTTWTDFTEMTKLITKKQGNEIVQAGAAIGTDKITNSQDILYLLMLQNETKIISENLQLATFNLPKETPRDTNEVPGKRALDFYTSFADKNNENFSWSDSLGNDIDAFANGKVAVIFGYSSLQNYLSQKYPSFTGYSKGSVPQLTEESDKIVDYGKFTAFGVSALAKNPTQSWGLINTLWDTDYGTALRLYKSKKSSSSSEISLKNRTSNSPESNELATAKSFTKGRYPIDFDNEIKNAIYSVNNNVQDSKSALDLAANNITELLRKTDW